MNQMYIDDIQIQRIIRKQKISKLIFLKLKTFFKMYFEKEKACFLAALSPNCQGLQTGMLQNTYKKRITRKNVIANNSCIQRKQGFEILVLLLALNSCNHLQLTVQVYV